MGVVVGVVVVDVVRVVVDVGVGVVGFSVRDLGLLNEGKR